jgi:hypothetical protein
MGRKPIPLPIKSLNTKIAKAFKAAKKKLQIKFRKLLAIHAKRALKSLLKSHIGLAKKRGAQLVNGRFVPIRAKVEKKRERPKKK